MPCLGPSHPLNPPKPEELISDLPFSGCGFLLRLEDQVQVAKSFWKLVAEIVRATSSSYVGGGSTLTFLIGVSVPDSRTTEASEHQNFGWKMVIMWQKVPILY